MTGVAASVPTNNCRGEACVVACLVIFSVSRTFHRTSDHSLPLFPTSTLNILRTVLSGVSVFTRHPWSDKIYFATLIITPTLECSSLEYFGPVSYYHTTNIDIVFNKYRYCVCEHAFQLVNVLSI